MTSLQRALRSILSRDPKRVALRDGDRSITGGELLDQSNRVASGLGVEPGDRVALMAPNGIEAVTIVLVCYLYGCTVVPLNYRFTVREASFVLQKVRPRVLVGHLDRVEIVRELAGEFPRMRTVGIGFTADQSFEDLQHAAYAYASAGAKEDQPALILMTSGSTGEPKGVIHTHQSVWEGANSARDAYGYSRSDVVLVNKPISHAGGLQTQLLAALLVGSDIVLSMRPAPAVAVELIKKHRVTVTGLLASDFLDFVEYLESRTETLPSLRRCVASGDAVPHDLHDRFATLLGYDPTEGCGITEAGTYYGINPMGGGNRRGSIGKPAPGFEVRVIDDQGEDVPVGETGEFALRSSAITPGYWKSPEQTQALFRDGWMLTGDLGHCDADGFLWFHCRKKLIIVRRGSNISPIEVEDVLDEHPLVHACVVVGVKDPRDGEVPVAFVTPKQGVKLTEDELINHASPRLAAYKTPARYIICGELPRTATGKFDRTRLREEAGGLVEGGRKNEE